MSSIPVHIYRGRFGLSRSTSSPARGSADVSDRYTLLPIGVQCLLRTVYGERRLSPGSSGIFRYKDGPSRATRDRAGRGLLRECRLCPVLGLSPSPYLLGYWPERGGRMETCSFKELEEQPTVLSLREKGAGVFSRSRRRETPGAPFCQVSG
jgi:cysteate synthase